ncbi:O-antigen ligase family protein [Sphingosinicellaceae bacterium]|nr:O-antigen ligase family protein [Sphingosinicellaceae bacterium]
MTSLIAILLLSFATLAALRLALPATLRHRIGGREFTMAALLPTVAIFSPQYFIFAGAMLAIVGMAPSLGGARPYRTADAMETRLRLMVFALPLLPMLQYTAMISTFTIAQLQSTALLCAGGIAALLNSDLRTPRARLATWDAGFAMLMLVQLFMDVRDNDVMYALRSIVQIIINLGLPYFIISRAAAMAKEPSQLLVALLFAACILSTIAVFESFRHWLLYEDMIRRVGGDPERISGYTKLRGGMLRARASFSESTGLGLFLGVMLSVLFALRRQVGSTRLAWLMATILLAGLMVTFARVGYVALAAGIVLSILHERRYRLLAVVAAILPPFYLGLRALGQVVPVIGASIGSSADSVGSVSYRSQLMDAGRELIAQNPLFGLGIHDLVARLSFLKQGEGIVDFVNQPLTILMRAGLIGGALYFLMTFRLAWDLFRQPGRDPALRAGAAACFAGLGALLAGLTTTSYGRNDITFFALLALGAGLMARQSSSVAAQPNAAVNIRVPARPAATPAPATASMSSS